MLLHEMIHGSHLLEYEAGVLPNNCLVCGGEMDGKLSPHEDWWHDTKLERKCVIPQRFKKAANSFRKRREIVSIVHNHIESNS